MTVWHSGMPDAEHARVAVLALRVADTLLPPGTACDHPAEALSYSPVTRMFSCDVCSADVDLPLVRKLVAEGWAR